MPPAYVKPYVKRQKNDVADGEAICEAVTRANMRFVPTKTPEQQSGLVLQRTRHLFIRQQTSVINAIRAHLAEFGVIAPVGRKGIEELLHVIADPSDRRVPDVVRACLAALGSQLSASRDTARALAKTEAFAQSRRYRKKVEMLFAHLKRILRLDRLRLRGPSGAQFEFTLAAIAQNLRRLSKLVVRPPPVTSVACTV
jgi:hypothetical protein